MSTQQFSSTATAVNPFDTRFNRDLMIVEVIDTRRPDAKPIDAFDCTEGNAQGDAEARADELWHNELRAARVDALTYDELVARDAAQLAEPAPVATPEPADIFTAIPVASILNELCDAVDYARSIAPAGAWWRAIDAAWDYLLLADVLHFDIERHALRVESATRPGLVYTANGDCQCEAFTKGDGVCFHRAAARLVRRALERRAAAQPAPRCLWRFGGTAAALSAYISAQRVA